MTSVPVKTASDRLPILDGFRAVSILLVLGAHSIQVAGFPASIRGKWFFLFDGELGVRFFFVISGFIITWILLREESVWGWISLPRFWWRRALRILPLYAVFVLVLVGVQQSTNWRLSSAGWFGICTFTSNYFASGQWLPAHLWSLSVEEQFYLLWPVVLAGMGVARNPRRVIWLLASVGVLCPVLRLIGIGGLVVHPLLNTSAFLLRADSLAYGCMAAVLLKCFPDYLAHVFSRRWPVAVSLVGLVGCKVWDGFQPGGVWMHSIVPSLQGGALALVLLFSQFHPKAGMFQPLQWRPIVWIGRVSYSLYLWQQLFSSRPETFGCPAVWWLCFPGWLVPTFVIAGAMHYGIEKPFLRLRDRFSRLRTDHGGIGRRSSLEHSST